MDEDALIIAELEAGRSIDFVLGELSAVRGDSEAERMARRLAKFGIDAEEYVNGYKYRNTIIKEVNNALERAKTASHNRREASRTA